MARVKICGISTPEALQAATEAGADWVGFVFYPRSPRYLTPGQAAALSTSYSNGPARVGLFVEPTDADVEAALHAVPLDALQVYASPARAAELRARFAVPVWCAIPVEHRSDLPQSAPGLDGLLIEAKPPADATRPGGNARRFDWSILRGWTAPAPWLLAGGLTPDNVGQAIETAAAAAVDVSSGVERAPGLKDPALIRRFVAAAKTTPSP